MIESGRHGGVILKSGGIASDIPNVEISRSTRPATSHVLKKLYHSKSTVKAYNSSASPHDKSSILNAISRRPTTAPIKSDSLAVADSSNPFNPSTYLFSGFSRPRPSKTGRPQTTATLILAGESQHKTSSSSSSARPFLDFPALKFLREDRTESHHHHHEIVDTSPDIKSYHYTPEMTRRKKIAVNVQKLYDKTKAFLIENSIDFQTGEFNGGGVINKENTLLTFDEQMSYLHAMFMWIVKSCIEETRNMSHQFEDMKNTGHDEEKSDRAKGEYKVMDHSLKNHETYDRVSNVKVDTLKPLNPITSKGAVIRRAQTSRKRTNLLKNKDSSTPSDQDRNSHRILAGLTVDEIKRVDYYMKNWIEIEKKKDPLNTSHQWFHESLTLASWLKTQHVDKTKNQKTGLDKTGFTVKKFLMDYIKLRKQAGLEVDEPRQLNTLPRQSFSHQRASLRPHERSNSISVPQPIHTLSTSDNPNMRRGAIRGIHNRKMTDLTPVSETTPIDTHPPPATTSSKKVQFNTNQVAPARRGTISNHLFKKHVSDSISADTILSSPTQNPWVYYKQDCIHFLQKPGIERTKAEILVLSRYIKNLKAFETFSPFILNEIASTLEYCKIDTNRVVFKQGDPALAWYIIASGSVYVQISNTGRIEDNVTVKVLSTGEGFGDLGLLNSSLRLASIITKEPCELLYVKKLDYNRVIKFFHAERVADMVNFLKSIPMFEGWSKDTLKMIAQNMSIKYVEPGDTIIKEGDPCNNLYFVRSGTVHLYKTISIDNTPTLVKVAQRGPRDYFCEEGALNDYGDRQSQFTIKAISPEFREHEGGIDEEYDAADDWLKDWVYDDEEDENGVGGCGGQGMKWRMRRYEKEKREKILGVKKKYIVLAVVAMFDVKSKFLNILTRSPVLGMTSSAVLAMHKQVEEKKLWKKLKKRQLNQMVKEMKRDCRLTYWDASGKRVLPDVALY